MAAGFVVLGRLVKPHGIAGGIRAEYYAESEELLRNPLLLRAGGMAPRPVRIREWSLWRDQLILFLEGCTDRSQAERFRGQELLMDASFLPEDDAPLLDDLPGIEVFLEDGTRLGVLEDASVPAGQELWSIRSDDGREILLPAVPEFVRSLDMEEGRAVVAPPEGLLELYAGNDGEDGQSAKTGKGGRKAPLENVSLERPSCCASLLGNASLESPSCCASLPGKSMSEPSGLKVRLARGEDHRKDSEGCQRDGGAGE